jgi:hypothetical protein
LCADHAWIRVHQRSFAALPFRVFRVFRGQLNPLVPAEGRAGFISVHLWLISFAGIANLRGT